MQKPQIFIVGAGSIGRYLAAQLNPLAHVTLIARRDRGFTGSSEGARTLEIKWSKGENLPLVREEATLKSFDEIAQFPPESSVFIAPKAFDLKSALTQIAPRLAQDTHLVLCQNGLAIADEARTQLAALNAPPVSISRAIFWLGVKPTNSGTLLVSGIPGGIEWASLPDSLKAPLTLQVIGLIEKSGIPVRLGSSIAQAEWNKALWNITLNALCALAGAPNRAAADDPDLRPIAEQVLNEALAVARAEGVRVSADCTEKIFEACRATGSNLNSTLQDLTAGRPTEIPWLNGAIVRLAAKNGIAVPINQALCQLIGYREKTRNY